MGLSTRRRDSVILTLSRRIDRVSGVVSFGVVVAALLFALVSGVFWVVPSMAEAKELEEQKVEAAEKKAEVEQEIRAMEDMLASLSDAYGIRRIAIERYGYKPTPEPVG